MIEDVLHMLGLPGSIILVASVGLSLYHGRNLLTAGAKLATWLRFGGVLALLAVVAYAGLIPGVSLSINLSIVVETAGRLWRLLPIDVIREMLPL